MTYTRRYMCPIQGCRHRCLTPDTLFVHIAGHHLKNDIVAALIRLWCGPGEPKGPASIPG